MFLLATVVVAVRWGLCAAGHGTKSIVGNSQLFGFWSVAPPQLMVGCNFCYRPTMLRGKKRSYFNPSEELKELTCSDPITDLMTETGLLTGSLTHSM